MEEETKINSQTNTVTSPNTTIPEWLTFKSKHEDITSKVEMRRDFYEETKANAKKLRSNKKNPTKKASYYSASSPLHPSKSEDHIYQTAIPNTITYTYEGLGSRLYNCKFTHDGKILLVTSQTGTAFFNFSDDNKIELSKVIVCNNINWAITDSDISSDNKLMIHSTLSPYVHLFDVEKSKYIKQFNIKSGRQSANEEDEEEEHGYWHYSLRVFSLKLSGDGREVIAGCSRTSRGAPIQVYDLVQGKLKHSIIAHQDDINSICYVDRENSSIFISGSDDGKCKLWDTRILADNKPVGVFHGHRAGLTCVSSKEDNRYFISNSKDQSIKLWDIRTADSEERHVNLLGFDYRYQRLGWNTLEAIKAQATHKNDQSVMTFWGHQVYGTLIRCHFSPLFGTGQRYIYSGSSDGKVYIYDTVNGNNIVRLNLPNESSVYDESPLVRDCAWHPYSQNLISTSFLEGIQRWEYMDLRGAEKVEEEEEWEDEAEEVVHEEVDDDEDDEDYDEEYEEDDEDYDPKEALEENESSEQEATH